MAPPIVNATRQAAVLSGTSNILAQALTAYRSDTPFIIDWVPVFQFVVFTLVVTPPNFMWQSFLEETWPAHHVSSDPKATRSDEKALGAKPAAEPKLNIPNTLIKALLDQTAGAVVNTFLFSLFMNSIQAAMVGAPRHTLAFLAHRAALDYSRVDWRAVVAQSRAEFWPIMQAGWRLWPFVSLVNFALIKTVEGRNLVGSLAGVAWGIYMSLIAAK